MSLNINDNNKLVDSRIRMFTMRNILNDNDDDKRKNSAYIIPNKIHPVVWKQRDLFDSTFASNLRLSKFIDACKLKNYSLALKIVQSSVSRPRASTKITRNSFIPNDYIQKKRKVSISMGHMRSSSGNIEKRKEGLWRTAELSEDAGAVQLRDYLLIACRYNLPDIAKQLIEYGADPKGDPSCTYSPVYVSCLFGSNEVFSSILAPYKIEVCFSDINGCTPLHLMILSGNLNSIDKLVDLGSDILALDSFNKLPLYYSYLTRNRDICKYIWNIMSYHTENITEIDLSRCGMNFFPDDNIIERFQHLEKFDISYNALHYISPAIGKLAALEEFNIIGNPLRALPSTFITNNIIKQKHYLNMLNHCSDNYCRRRVVVMGCESVGKTSLIQSLRPIAHLGTSPSQSVKNPFLTLRQSVFKQDNKVEKINECFLMDDEILRNNELEISDSVVLSSESSRATRVIFWEIPSKLEPHTHYLLKGEVVFIIVYNLEELDLKDIDTWLSSIKSVREPDSCSPIFLVGTHSDNPLCTNEHILAVVETLQQRYPLSYYKGLYEDHFLTVNCNNPQTLKDLRKKIIRLISNPKYSDKVFPRLTKISWLIFKQLLKNMEEPYMLKEDILHALHACNIPSSELLPCITFLQSCDNILSFDLNTKDKHLLVLNIDWWIGILSKFLSPNNPYLYQNGVLHISDLYKYFPNLSTYFLEELIYVLEEDYLVFQLHSELIIPSLLSEVKPPEISEVWPTLAPIGKYECQRIYRYSQTARNLFVCVQKEVLHTPSIQNFKLWQEGIYFEANEQQILITISVIKRSYQLLISIRYPQEGIGSNAGMMLVVCEILEGLIRGSYPQLLNNVKRLIPCVHCLMLRVLTGKTFLFKYDDCYRAVTQGNPFVFCNDIASPSRCVRVDKLAPDIAFADINQIKENEFTVGRLLGKGGFGSVYYGLLHNTKEIAIKELTLRSDCSEEEKISSFGEFLREAYIMSFLNHPNLVSFKGVCLSTLPRLLMEYVPCGDLSNLIISKEEPLEEWLIRKIALDIAVGMNHLHSISPPIIHRDLRSPNIFLVSLDKQAPIIAKIADFGLSRMKASQLQETLSTYQWMAPETLGTSGKKVEYDEKADVYSFGVILWELLTLEFPFDEYLSEDKYTYTNPVGDIVFNTNAVKEAIEFDNLRPTIPDNTPEDLRALLCKCWHHKSSKRPSFYEVILRLKPDYNFPQTMNNISSGNDKLSKQSTNENELSTVVNSVKCTKSIKFHSDDDFAPCTGIIMDERLWISCHNGLVSIYDINVKETEKKKEEQRKLQEKLEQLNEEDNSEEDSDNNKEDNIQEINEDKEDTINEDIKDSNSDNNTIIVENERNISSWQAHLNAIYCMIYVEKKRNKEVWLGGTDGMISIYPSNATEQRSLKKKWSLSKEKIARLRSMAVITTKNYKTVWVADISTKIRIINTETYETISSIEVEKRASIFTIIQHSDGKVWIGSIEGIYVFDPDTYQLLQWFSAHSNCQVLSLISVGDNVWSGSSDGKISVWTSNFEKLTTLTAHTSKIFCFCIDYKGYVWSGSFDTTIIIWDPKTYKPIEELAKHKDSIRSLSKYDKCIWSTSIDNTLKKWEYTD